MTSVTVEPYFFFKGNCKEAMEFYKSVFGGELEIQTMGEAPKGMQAPGSSPSDIMHASLKGPVNLMASDSNTASDKASKVEISIGGTEEADMRKVFDSLSEGGKVRMPLSKQFWGDIFGMTTDKYGIDWMMNIGTNLS